jgi:hypothetical protein
MTGVVVKELHPKELAPMVTWLTEPKFVESMALSLLLLSSGFLVSLGSRGGNHPVTRGHRRYEHTVQQNALTP